MLRDQNSVVVSVYEVIQILRNLVKYVGGNHCTSCSAVTQLCYSEDQTSNRGWAYNER
jgi:hypothetical protein